MYTITGVRHSWPEPAGFRLKRDHGHPDFSFVHFENEVDMVLNGKEMTLPPHACIIYRPGTPHHFISHRPLVHDWFHFQGNPPPEIPLDAVFSPYDTDFIPGLVHEMENEFWAKRTGWEMMLHIKTTELFLKLSRALDSAPKRRVYADPVMREKLWKLRQNVFHSLDQPWTVQQMAAGVGLSPSRFHEIYRAVYGRSPIDDMIRARIDSARHMLLFTSKPIAAIAESLGYLNETHFIRQFKQFTGCTPSRYRRELADQ